MPPIVADPVISFLRHRSRAEEYGHHADYRYPSRNITSHKAYINRPHQSHRLGAPSGGLPCRAVEKAPAIEGRGKLAERIEVEFGPFRPAASRRAECLLVALPTSWDLLLCAKDLFVEPLGGARASFVPCAGLSAACHYNG